MNDSMLEVPINEMRVITNALKPIFASAVTCSLLVLLIGCINYGGGPDTDEIEIIGAVSIILLTRLNQTSREMYIPELVVQHKYQRNGIGKMLIDACIDLAKNKKCYRIRLESGNQRKVSHHSSHRAS